MLLTILFYFVFVCEFFYDFPDEMENDFEDSDDCFDNIHSRTEKYAKYDDITKISTSFFLSALVKLNVVVDQLVNYKNSNKRTVID